MIAFLDISEILQIKAQDLKIQESIENISKIIIQQSKFKNLEEQQLQDAKQTLVMLHLSNLKLIKQKQELLDIESVSLIEIKQQNQKINLIKVRIQEFNQQFNTEQQRLQQLVGQEMILENKLSKLNLEKNSLKNALDKLTELIFQNTSIQRNDQEFEIQSQLIEIQSQLIEISQQNIKNIQDDINSAQQDTIKINNQKQMLNKKLQLLENQLQELTTQQQQLNQIIQQNQTELESLEKARIISEQEYMPIQFQIEIHNQRVAQLNSDKKSLAEQLDNIVKNLQLFSEKLSPLTQNQQDIKDEIAQMFLKLQEKNQEKKELEQKLEDRKTILGVIESQNLKFCEQRIISEKKIVQNQFEFQNNNEQLDLLQTTHIGLLNDLKTTQINIQLEQLNIKQLQNEKYNKEQQIKQLGSKLKWLDQEQKLLDDKLKLYVQKEEEYLILQQTQKEDSQQLEQELREFQQELLQDERQEQQFIQNNNSITQIFPTFKMVQNHFGSLENSKKIIYQKNQLNLRKIEIQNRIKQCENYIHKILINQNKNKQNQFQCIIAQKILNQQINDISNQLRQEQISIVNLNQSAIEKENLLVDLKQRESIIKDNLITSNQQVVQQEQQINDQSSKIIEFEFDQISIIAKLQNLQMDIAQQNKIKDIIICQIQEKDQFIQQINQQINILDKQVEQLNININELLICQKINLIQLNQIKEQEKLKDNEIFLYMLQTTQLGNTEQEQQINIKKLKSNLQENQQQGHEISKKTLQISKDCKHMQYELQYLDGNLSVLQNHLQLLKDEYFQENVKLTNLFSYKQKIEQDTNQLQLKNSKMQESMQQKQGEFEKLTFERIQINEQMDAISKLKKEPLLFIANLSQKIQQCWDQEQSINYKQIKISEELEKLYQRVLLCNTCIFENQTMQDKQQQLLDTLEDEINKGKDNLNIDIKQEQINYQTVHLQQDIVNVSIVKNAL